MQYRADIDALRGVAVSAVVIFHAFPNLLPGGYLGVDVFFVISGFLITSIIYRQFQTDSFELWGFYKRRIARLTPSLIVVLLATLVLVRRQGFWDRWAPELREDLAHLVGLIMRPICGEASAVFRWSFV
ncbi:acyltransferase, partial [Cognatishimia sp. MH4019]|uniref:acyltransferase family protein n=1 Tax=Cognatishimia sp. MH4019 TaxID=2854030 RepID=UPI001CD239E0